MLSLGYSIHVFFVLFCFSSGVAVRVMCFLVLWIVMEDVLFQFGVVDTSGECVRLG